MWQQAAPGNDSPLGSSIVHLQFIGPRTEPSPKNITQGNFREPPTFTFSSLGTLQDESCAVLRCTRQSGLPDVASQPVRHSFREFRRPGAVGSLNNGAKSGSLRVLLELLGLLLYVGSVHAHTPTRRHADTPQICP